MSTYPVLSADPTESARPRSTIGREYGWRRALPGQAYPAADTSGLTILPEVDPRPGSTSPDVPAMSPVTNQLISGICTAGATASAFRYDGICDGKDPGDLARLWLYRFTRIIEGTLSQGDVGATGHDDFTVALHGLPAEGLWPYYSPQATPAEALAALQATPPAACDPASARAYWLRKPVATVAQEEEAIRAVLSNRQVIALGFTVYTSFETPAFAASGIMPMPAPGEQVLGGHEVVVCGYLSDYPAYLLVRNDWGSVETDGTEWGIGGDGYFLMPLEYVLDPSRCADLRTIVRPVVS